MSPAEREVLRLRVVAALESGRVEGYRQAAEVFGVSERSVGTWWRAYRREGRDGLATRTGRPGPAELINAADRGTLFTAMADYTPEELLIGGPLWTRQAVVELIRLVVGVDMTEQGVGLWLRRHGFTPQRPARRAYEQQPAAVRAWLDEQYPAIETRAKSEGAAIAWVDQCGLHSDAAPPGRSWAPKGRTPIMRVTGKRLRVNVMSAVASRGALWFTVFTERFTAPVFTAFLDRVASQAGRKVHVVADRHPVHRSNADRVELHLMPGYSPELNPDELLNADLKRNVNASRAHTVDRLAHESRRFLRRRQRQPHIVRGYFRAPHVRYAIM
ncbi:transposase [Saccharothrix ecbatanensis]|uniref:Transposase n=1 Tax=Saccharothrix ecbatanensis TaxID=1105145 RepID=A0A7W9HIR8_9PSEU|nr:IS630 family transposase [Saccharothrix ecbatanensis]MBB5803072.1 transposase [Saccharothrix ecbatanensis]